MGDDDIVPVPQVLIDAIGQTRTFVVKISSHNLEGKTQTLTVTKVLPLESPEPEAKSGDDVDVELGSEGGGLANESVKRAGDDVGSEDAKRAKCG